MKDFYQSTKPTRTIRIVGLIDITALIRVETHSKNRVAICWYFCALIYFFCFKHYPLTPPSLIRIPLIEIPLYIGRKYTQWAYHTSADRTVHRVAWMQAKCFLQNVKTTYCMIQRSSKANLYSTTDIVHGKCLWTKSPNLIVRIVSCGPGTANQFLTMLMTLKFTKVPPPSNGLKLNSLFSKGLRGGIRHILMSLKYSATLLE